MNHLAELFFSFWPSFESSFFRTTAQNIYSNIDEVSGIEGQMFMLASMGSFRNKRNQNNSTTNETNKKNDSNELSRIDAITLFTFLWMKCVEWGETRLSLPFNPQIESITIHKLLHYSIFGRFFLDQQRNGLNRPLTLANRFCGYSSFV